MENYVWCYALAGLLLLGASCYTALTFGYSCGLQSGFSRGVAESKTVTDAALKLANQNLDERSRKG